MVTMVIRGHRLDGHLFGTKPCPPEVIFVSTVSNETDSCIINPEYERWIAKDQLLMGWLYNSMTENVAVSVMGNTTAASLWKALESLFGAHSKSKANAIRTSNQTTRKGGSTMDEYLRQMKTWSDTLAISGDPYPNFLLVANILAELDAEYMPIVVLLESKDSLTWQELHDTLLSFDSKLEHVTNASNKGMVSPAPSALLATSRPTNSSTNRPPNQQYLNNNPGGYRAQQRGGNRGGRFRGRGGRVNNDPKPTCQVCGKYDHSAAACYHRFNESYMGSSPRNNTAPQSAFLATPEIVDDAAWYADSGATSHITNNAGQANRNGGVARET